MHAYNCVYFLQEFLPVLSFTCFVESLMYRLPSCALVTVAVVTSAKIVARAGRVKNATL
jgi:hypothetical protein